jgi:hypothetical protein
METPRQQAAEQPHQLQHGALSLQPQPRLDLPEPAPAPLISRKISRATATEPELTVNASVLPALVRNAAGAMLEPFPDGWPNRSGAGMRQAKASSTHLQRKNGRKAVVF